MTTTLSSLSAAHALPKFSDVRFHRNSATCALAAPQRRKPWQQRSDASFGSNSATCKRFHSKSVTRASAATERCAFRQQFRDISNSDSANASCAHYNNLDKLHQRLSPSANSASASAQFRLPFSAASASASASASTSALFQLQPQCEFNCSLVSHLRWKEKRS